MDTARRLDVPESEARMAEAMYVRTQWWLDMGCQIQGRELSPLMFILAMELIRKN